MRWRFLFLVVEMSTFGVDDTGVFLVEHFEDILYFDFGKPRALVGLSVKLG